MRRWLILLAASGIAIACESASEPTSPSLTGVFVLDSLNRGTPPVFLTEFPGGDSVWILSLSITIPSIDGGPGYYDAVERDSTTHASEAPTVDMKQYAGQFFLGPDSRFLLGADSIVLSDYLGAGSGEIFSNSGFSRQMANGVYYFSKH